MNKPNIAYDKAEDNRTASPVNHPDSGRDLERCAAKEPAANPRTEMKAANDGRKSDSQGAAAPKELPQQGTLYESSSGLYQWDDEDKRWYRVSDLIRVIANVSDEDGGSYGLLVKWKDNRRRPQQWAIPMGLFAGDRGDHRPIIARLLEYGLRVEPGCGGELVRHLYACGKSARRMRLTNRTGWQDGQFVLADGEIVGPRQAGELLVFEPQRRSDHAFHVSGTAAEWRDRIGQKCRGNSRLLVNTSAGFVGPLIKLSNEESAILHLLGTSSQGKSTAQHVGGSVLGGGASGFLRSWRSTDNALERTLANHSDSTLYLEELHLAPPQTVLNMVYMLANQSGKNRMEKDTTAKPTLQWRVLAVSSGEVTLEQHVRSVSKNAQLRGGATVRMINIAADAGQGMGIFEDLHGAKSAKAFAEELRDATQRVYGHPFRVFLKQLTARLEENLCLVQRWREQFLEACALDAATASEVWRVANRFALVAAAGELAMYFGVTGWEPGEATEAAVTCFASWRLLRGSEQLAYDTGQGLRGVGGEVVEYLFLPEPFEIEVLSGFDVKLVLHELDRGGHLRREDNHLSIKPRLPGLGSRVYCVRSTILEDE
jgi:putative DNA primase/helicase